MNNLGAFKFSSLILGLLTGMGGTSVTITHFVTLESIEDSMKKGIILTSAGQEEKWKAIHKRLTSSSSKPKSETLIKIKESKESESSIQNWCFFAYSQNYRSAIITLNQELKQDVKEFCIYQIRDNLETENKQKKIIKHREQQKWVKKLSEFKNHNDDKKNGILYGKLKQLKSQLSSSATEDDKNWEKLRDWCKYSLGSPFMGKEKKEYKLTETYCIES